MRKFTRINSGIARSSAMKITQAIDKNCSSRFSKHRSKLMITGLMLVLLNFMGNVANGQAPPSCSTTGSSWANGPVSLTYNFSGSINNWTVPTGVTSVTVDMQGATGGGTPGLDVDGYQSPGGNGGRVEITGSGLSVTPGHTLSILVGGAGSNSGGGGYGGGGSDAIFTPVWPGSGGGGYSSIKDGTTILAIAGGGGGGGGDAYPYDYGGDGGGTTAYDGYSFSCGTGGLGGSSSSGGAGEVCTFVGGNGGFLVGGVASSGNGSGGGGGGYYGGGAGAEGGGGGGGSSYTNPTYAVGTVNHYPGYNSSGNGTVAINFTPTTLATTFGVDAFFVTAATGSNLNQTGLAAAVNSTTGYLDRSGLTPITLYQGNSFASSISWGTAASNQEAQVWIDFNDDGIFQASEEVTGVLGYSATGSAGTVNFSITIPPSAATGVHRMRVRGIMETSGTYGLSSDLDPCLSQFGGSGPVYNHGDAIDYAVLIAPEPACTGTPVAGTASATPAAGVSTTSFTLSLAGTTLATGLTYQWQSSPDGSSWSNIGGATDPTYTFSGLFSNTYYQCVVTCGGSGLSGTSTTVYVPVFCQPFYYYGCSSYSTYTGIISLTGDAGTSISDGSTCSPSTTDGYYDEYGITLADMTAGHTYSATLSGGSFYYFFTSAQVWIDFNDNGVFESSESVGGISTFNGYTGSTNLVIPLSATPGTHRMRVCNDMFGLTYPSLDPCGNDYYGDAKDYQVFILPPPPAVAGSPVALDFGDIGISTTATQTFVLTGTNLLPAAGTFTVTAPANYQVSNDGSSWASSYTIPYTGGALTATVYVEFVAPGTVGTYAGNISVNGGGIASTYLEPVTGNAATPCVGTPVAGTAVATPTGGTGATTFVLSLTGTSIATGLSFQWQSSPDGSSWSSISGATNTTYSFSGLASSTYYQCIVTCAGSGLSGTSTPVYVPVYCQPYYYYGCSSYSTYTGVISLTGESGTSISDASTCSPSTADGYYDEYSTTLVNMNAGTTYSATLNGGSFYYFFTSAQVWIDFNDNGVFESSESVGGISTFSGYTEATNLVIPLTANPGTHRMRVCNDMFGLTYPGLDPCGNDFYGDAKDYQVFIVPPAPAVVAVPNPISFPPTTVGTSATTSTSLTGSFLVPSSGTFTVTAPANFQVSNDGSSWTSSYTISYTGGTLPATNVYVQFNPTALISYGGNITVDGGGISATYDIPVSGDGATLCSGTPTAGSAGVTPSSGGNTTPFLLSLTGFSASGGLTFQWQSSPDGTTWSNITGATLNTYNFTGITANEYYQCIVTCSASGQSATSTSTMATFAPTPGCTPTAASWTNENSFYVLYGASGFSVTGYSGSNLNDNSIQYEVDGTTGYGAEYGGYSPVTMLQGNTYNGSVTWDFTNAFQYAQVWIDFNNDGNFDATEEVTPVTGYSTFFTSSPTAMTLTIPSAAPTGIHLMRMRAIWEKTSTDIGSAPAHTDPCLVEYGGSDPQYWSGTVTDYYANIMTPPPALSAAPASILFPPTTTGTSSATIPTTLTGSFLVPAVGTLTVTAPSGFQVSSDGSSWGTTYTISYTGGTVPATTIYVQFDPVAITSYSGNVTVDGGGASTLDIPVSGAGAAACSGTPTAGTATVTPSAGSATTPFTLTVSGYSVSGGLSFQWQSSPDGSSWTNITGATTIVYNFTGITQNEFYQCVVTCVSAGLSATTNATPATFIPDPTCTPTSSSWVNEAGAFFAPYYEYGAASFSITGYSGSNLNDASIFSEINTTTGYGAEYGTYPPVVLLQNNSYSGSITWGVAQSHQFAQVWIDFNNDGTFDPSEEVTSVTGYGGVTANPTAMTLNIPSAGAIGTHLMRMRAVWEENSTDLGSAPAHEDPCQLNYLGTDPSYWSGTTTDYYVTIMTPPPSVVAVPNPLGFPPTTTGGSSAPIPTVLTGSYLVPSVGTLAVTAPTGFQVSSDGSTWVGSYTIPYTGGVVPATTIYVQFDPTASTSYSDFVAVDGGGIAATYDIFVTGTGAPACSGTPTPGTAVVTPTSGGASTPFALTVTGYSVAGGVGFQWQSSPDGTTWSNIVGATLATYNFTGISENEYYQCIVTCSYSGLSATTNAALATFAPTPGCTTTSASWAAESGYYYYGAASFTVNGYSGSTLDDEFIQYEIDPTTGYAAEYGTYPAVTLLQNNSYSGTIGWDVLLYHQMAQVWIDFNNDGSFDPSEEVTPVSGYSSSGTISPTALTLTIPATAATGLHLMRMRTIVDEYFTDLGVPPGHLDPCLSQYGGAGPVYVSGTETDYYVNIMTPPPSVVAVPNPLGFPPTTTGGSSAPIPTVLTGSYLLPSVGMLTVTAPTGFQVSSDGSTWVTSYTIAYTGGTVPPTTVYVQFDPTASTSYSDFVAVDGGGLAATYDIFVTGVGAPPCSGTPTAGTATVTPASGGGTTPFTLTVTGYSLAGGVGFQWQSSPDGTTWSNITGATLATYNFTGISQNEYYQCIVTCSYSGLSATTNSTLATFNPSPTCTTTSSSWVNESGGFFSPYYEYGAASFSVTGYSGSNLNDASIFSEINTSTGYGAEYGTYPSVVLLQNNSYSGSVTWGVAQSHQFAQVWIDFNNDGTFDPSEEVTPVTGYGGTTTNPTAMTLSIPPTAALGLHLMRMRAVWEENSTDLGSAPAHEDPCQINYLGTNPSYWSGTTTDYYVTIMTPPPSVVAVPNPLGFPPTTTGGSSAPIPTVLTGSYLVPSVGTLNVTAPTGFLVSSDGSTWVGSYTIPYTGGVVPATTIYVQFDPTASISYSDFVAVDGGGLAATYDIFVTGTGAPACSGTPTAGTAVVTPTSGGGTTPFTLSVTGYSVAGGVGFQWQSSPDGTTWTNIAGATLSTYNFTGISENEYYQCIVTCSYSGLSANTNSALATFSPTPSCTTTSASWAAESGYYYYGAASFTVNGYSGSTLDDEFIQYEIDPTSGYAAEYGVYGAVNMQQNSSYSGSVSWEVLLYHQMAQVWIDFNNDGTFDPSEEVTPVSGYSAGGTTSPTALTLTLPVGAAPGVHLMRMRSIVDEYVSDLGYAPAHLDPCLSQYGGAGPIYVSGTETDYYANILCNTAAIGGTLSTCYSGGTTMLTDVETGGTWISDAPSVASVGTDGTVTGGVAGTATITYQIAATGCMATAVVTINSAPAAITGGGTVCGGSTLSLGETAGGGSWYSLSPAIGSVDAVSGVVTGLTTGTVTIGYVNGCGPDATTVVTVNAPTVSGTPNICISTSTTLIGAPAGGTWQSLTPSVATIDLTSGLVTATTTTGTTSIIYTYGGCTNVTSPFTVTVSNTAPTGILGANVVCTGATITLSDAVTGGGWSSSNTAVATTAPDGTITGVTAGTANIVYSTGCGSDVSVTVTVNASPAPLTGIFVACVGQTTTLVETTGGVTWSSSASGIASVDASGVVTGVSTGTALISVTIPATGCTTTAVVSVGSTYPSAITITPSSTGTVCLGGSAAFTASATYTGTILSQNFNSGMTDLTGGTWTVLNTGTASSYNWAMVAPFAWGDISIAGDGTNFMGANADLAGSSVTLNTSLLTPTFSTVGYTSASLTYNYYCRSDAAYDFAAEVDYSIDGGTTWNLLHDYFNTTTGNTSWVAGTPDQTLALPGAALGQPNVQIRWYYYTNFGWYWAVDNVVLTGTKAPAYTWAGIGTADGLSCTSCATNTITPTVPGVNVYTVYATGGSCYTTTSVTVNVNTITAAPSNDGPACAGGTVHLLSNVGGTATPVTYHWSGPGGFTANTADVTLTGVTTAMGGTYNFTVTATGSDCIATGSTNVVVNTFGIAAANDGPACVGGSINLSSTPSGTETPVTYSWSGPGGFTAGVQNTLLTSSATTAMAGAYTVTVTGAGSGCSATNVTNVVVNTIATAPSNDGPACVGATVHLLSNITGTATGESYSWSGPGGFTAITANATLSSVTTAMAGTYNFTVTATGSNCVATGSTDVTVSSLGVVASNDGPACVGGTVNLTATPSGTPTGYSWSGPSGFTSTSQNPVLTTSATTDMSGTYTVTASNAGCSVTSTTVVTINTIGITAANNGPVCVGNTVNLTSTPSGTASSLSYTWSGPLSFTAGTQNTLLTTSATTAMAGDYTVTVTAPGSGCSATGTTSLIVNSLGVSASNDGPACVGGTINLSATPSGTASSPTYSWSGPIGFGSTNQNPAVTGLTLLKAGVYTVTASAGAGCSATATTTVVVQTMFISAANDGPTCIGSTVNLTSTPSGTAAPVSYAWSGPISFTAGTQNTLLTSVTTSMSGTYTVIVTGAGSGCTATATTNVSILGLPASITGGSSICVGATTTVSDVTTGGVWSSSNTGVATIGSTGSPRVVTGLFAGTATISYSIGTGCASTLVVTVNPNPVITDMAPVCVGSTITLGSDIPGGLWTAANTKATVGSTSGIVTGVAFGTDNITYTLPTTCRAISVETISPLPSSIGGTATVCQGMTTTLNTTSSGGSWISSNPAVATATPTGGTTTITGITAGSATISYVLPTGCYSTRVVTVNALSPITGNAPVCQGATVTLSDAALGGLWTSGSLARATVGSVSGVVTGISGGTTHISYTTFEGCLAVVTITVNPVAAITGTASVCEGATTTLNDATAGGTWSSSNTNATVAPGVGVVTGVTAGTATISYIVTSTGCTATRDVTVNAAPAPISGAPVSLCVGGTTILSDAVSGGTWISGSTGKATIGSSDGTVTGIASGTSLITYKITAGGCQTTTMATINVTPGPITGNAPVCQSSTVLLHDGTAGGSWSTSDVTAMVGSTGLVTGLSGGTATITYGISVCQATVVVTINPIATITGTAPMCVGGSVALTDATSGGTWSSSNPAKATVDASGLVAGIAAGTAKITYLITATGCKSIVTETVNANPAAITGTMTVCSGGSVVALHDATAGGTWSTVAGTGSVFVDGTGGVTGSSAGTATVSYSVLGCGVATTVTVNSSPAAITGNSPVCAGSLLPLGETVSGGTWSSTTPSVATVNSSGVVTAVVGGTSTISYATGAGCNTSVVVTVNTILPITGMTTLCLGSTTSLADASFGGTWMSGDAGTASVGTSGIVTGNLVGTATISYTSPTGCVRTVVVTVNPLPSPISGTLSLCSGSTTTLSDAGSGTWTSTNAPVATISATGVVTAVSAGTSTIKYTSGAGCFTSVVVTVNAGPSPIGGASSVCVGSTIPLSDFLGGGSWTVTGGFATIDGTGHLTGTSGPGTVSVTYTAPTGGCYVTRSFIVNTVPAPISGNALVCIGGTTFLSDATSGGTTWTSGSTSVATVSASGAVNGVSAGTANITYTIGDACTATIVVTVNPQPSAITGNAPVCPGYTVMLADATGGGTWSSSNPVIASVGSDGTVTGGTAGLASITYTVPGGGCHVTTVVTVSSITAITGLSSVCTGSSIALTDAATGGTWFSTSGNVSVGPTGIVTGVTAGTAVISYTFSGSGCSALKTVTVNTTPTAINGNGLLCIGSTLMLTDGVTGGVWSSSNTSVAAVVGSTGVTTGMATGTARITYNNGGCQAVTIVTVNSASGITGLSTICAGLTDNMHNSTIGGTWSSSNTAVGTISTTGVLTSFIAGTTTVSYSLASGCVSTFIVTVNPVPDPITGNGPVCVGGTLALADDVTGGTWYSSTGVITVDGSGNVSAIATGTATVIYTAGGCTASTIVTVGATPAAIAGTLTVCEGSTTLLYDATIGGVWSSSTGSATVDPLTGLVSGVTAGTTTISYIVAGCGSASADVTVNATPAAITGSIPVCIGSGISLVETTGGGAWSASNGNATVDGSGNVTGVTAGTTTISYTVGSCSAATVVTVAGMPAAITGSSTVCVGGSTTLHDVTPGGLWSSVDATITVGTGTGVVTGVSVGTASITYTTATGCIATTIMTVNAAASPITGFPSVCIGSTTALTDASSGGVWSSSNASIASVGTDGTVTGVSAGSATISYAVSGCTTTMLVTVSSTLSGITGASAVCVGSTIALTDATPGGGWSTGSSLIAVDGSGNVTGSSAGVATVTYTAGSGCFVTKTINVNPQPSAINGQLTVCVGATTFLTDGTSGGVSWTSGSPSNATVSYSGAVVGVAAGTSTITYMISTGCTITAVVTVNTVPAPITNNSVVCQTTSITLSDATAGGAWSSNNSSIASVGSATGTVLGVSGGNTIITYAMTGAGCYATAVVTVSPSPVAGTLSGAGIVCAGSTTTFSDAVSGGVWSSTSTANATVNTTGVVTGVLGGTSTISYTVTNFCGSAAATAVVTVNPGPVTGSITGTASVCAGSTTALTDLAPGGVWSSGTPVVATVDASGLVTGVAGGTARISYTVTSGCGSASATSVVTVTPFTGGTIIGATSVLVGFNITLSDAVTGGIWSASNGNATVGTTGVVTGVAAGTVTISYAVTNACGTAYASTVVTVSASSVSPITGTAGVCVGTTSALTDATPGGTWHSSNTFIATVGATGIVTGVAAGTATISYTVGGIPATVVVTVSTAPSGIGGSTSVCVGSSVTMSDFVAGGTWTSTAGVSLTPGSASTVVSVLGLSAGSNTVTYSLGTGCYRTFGITVNPVPLPITGTFSVCIGATAHVADPTGGGTSWTSSTTSVATISASGTITGVSAGTTTITYTISTGCKATAVVTAQSCPAPHAHGTTVSGTTVVFEGSSVSIADENVSGIWSSSNTDVATVDGIGSVTGIAPGSANITHVFSYSDGEVGTTVTPVVVNSLPVDVRVVPNPNNGTFTVKGTIGTMQDEEVSLEVTDVLGQVIYKNKVTAHGGKINETVVLSNVLANGMYMLNMHSGAENKVFHFVIEK